MRPHFALIVAFLLIASSIAPASSAAADPGSTSQITRPQGPPIAADWRLNLRDGLYKISAVVIDGVSMAATRRTEFAQQIEHRGGRLAPLLAGMREQAAGVGATSLGNPYPGPDVRVRTSPCAEPDQLRTKGL
jgi:hypothetical protein